MNDPKIDTKLNLLNEAIDKMRKLQADAHPGLFTWNQMMRERLLEIKKEIIVLVGK